MCSEHIVDHGKTEQQSQLTFHTCLLYVLTNIYLSCQIARTSHLLLVSGDLQPLH